MHIPTQLSWRHLRYDDPDVPLTQSDEDKIIGAEPPQDNETGQFAALQIGLTLGSSTYATMALREITKEDTSAHNQTILTSKADDQQFKGVDRDDVEEEKEDTGEVGDGEDVDMNAA